MSSDRLGVSVAFGGTHVVKLYYRMEEGTAPELEIGRYLEAKGLTGITPRVLGYVEYRVPRSEPVTLAIIEEYVVNEGTAWQHARSEIGRAYERVLAQPPGTAPPALPVESLLELAFKEPSPEQAELLGAYRDAAMRLGRRTAELHVALAASTDASFEPKSYSAMDQRSKYQTARNQVGRVLATLRRTQGDLPATAQEAAGRLARRGGRHPRSLRAACSRSASTPRRSVITATCTSAACSSPARTSSSSTSEARATAGSPPDGARGAPSATSPRCSSPSTTRRRPRSKRCAPRTRRAPRRGAGIWLRGAAAAFLRGYLDTANDASFLPKSQATRSVLLETALLEKAFGELRTEMRDRPELAWIPMRAILRLLRTTR